uniref:Uncharacterized protein n=1 Tax=Arundo donax TaxID=35708 RepID=A0A0A9C0Y2_ARUDO
MSLNSFVSFTAYSVSSALH